MADLTLDISEIQIVVHYPGDPGGFDWHHRVLLHRIEGGRWITLTPDLELQRHDLSIQNHRVLDRAAPFPADIAALIYAHDPIGRAALSNFRRQAQIQASILGESAVIDSEASQWVVAESTHSDFGRTVDAALLANEATGLAFTMKGVIILEGEEVFVERVMISDLDAWKRKRDLEAADVRLLGDHRDASGKKVLGLRQAVPLMKCPMDPEFPIQGARAAKEFHEAVSLTTEGFLTYHSEWVRLSGANRKTSSVHIHRAICEALRLMHSFDQLDVSALAMGEHLTRWVIQTELAVERNPAAPDFSGLDIVSGTAQLPDGRAATTKFSEWVSARLKERGAAIEETETMAEAKETVRRPELLRAALERMMGDIWRRVAMYGECPAEVTEASSLGDLCRRANLYSQEACHLVDTDLGKIKILRRRLQPQDARDLAPPETKCYLDKFNVLVERTPEELEGLRDTGNLVEPYWDPRLRRDRLLRLQLYRALFEANLLTFRRRRKARVGFFTVRKKDTDQQRLIIDARQANSCHRPPPTTRLATPAGMTNLDLSPGTLESDGFGGYLGEACVTSEAGDVGDCFYNFTVPALAAWFCTDDDFDQAELADLGIHVDAVYDDEADKELPLRAHERVYAAFKGVPMGEPPPTSLLDGFSGDFATSRDGLAPIFLDLIPDMLCLQARLRFGNVLRRLSLIFYMIDVIAEDMAPRARIAEPTVGTSPLPRTFLWHGAADSRCTAGVHFIIENPQTSRLWEFGPIRDIFLNKHVCFFTFHTWGHVHERLKGSVMSIVDGATGTTSPETVLSFLHGVEAAARRAHRPHDADTDEDLRAGHKGQDSYKFLRGAKRYLQTHPVIFGHFTAKDIARLAGYKKFDDDPEKTRKAQDDTRGGKPSSTPTSSSFEGTQKTLDRYYKHVREFEAWARAHGHRDDEVQPSNGAYVIYGLQLLRNIGPKQESSSTTSASWQQQRGDLAFALSLQYDTYLRPSELLGLTVDHVGYPAGERTKQGTSDDSVMIADMADRRWLSDAMELYVGKCKHELFPGVTLSFYERWCEKSCKQLGSRSTCIMPHILRHSGASNDMFHNRRSLNEIQKRGRWQARKSVTRYEKHALLLKRWEQASPKRVNSIRRQSQSFGPALVCYLKSSER
ncbi:unnamed protein product [Symbiodinium sp. CCMP2592]|nr:unnamed protein product [Symbiodinium sp. CCMP2592]